MSPEQIENRREAVAQMASYDETFSFLLQANLEEAISFEDIAQAKDLGVCITGDEDTCGRGHDADEWVFSENNPLVPIAEPCTEGWCSHDETVDVSDVFDTIMEQALSIDLGTTSAGYTNGTASFVLCTGGPHYELTWDVGNPDSVIFLALPWFDRVEFPCVPDSFGEVAAMFDDLMVEELKMT